MNQRTSIYQTIAFIPARGGSKGIPGKNLAPFRGEPLLNHSIKTALNAKCVDLVVVSTDCTEIARVAKSAGAMVVERPAEISGDTATTESAIEHCISYLQKKDIHPESVILLQATSPLRPAGSLDQAFTIFKDGEYDSLLSISPTHRFFWKITPTDTIPEYDFLNRPRRQDIKPENLRYVENGSLYIFSTLHFSNFFNRLGGKIGHIIFPEEYSYEIDSLADLKFLESLAETLPNPQNF